MHDDELEALADALGVDPAVVRRVADAVTSTLAEETFGGAWTDELPASEAPGAGRYEVGALLGKGSFGQVHRVLDRVLGRQVARKRLAAAHLGDARAVAAFTTEARTTAQLEHPGLAPVYDLGEDADGPWFTMREIVGDTLSKRVQEAHAEPVLPLRRLVGYVHRAAEAVAYAHARGVVHRDLKPDNVMIGAFGEVLVVDWGIASGAGSRGRGVSGTPAYMSPEQALGEAVDARADVYGLGGVLYHALSGAPPMRGTAETVLAGKKMGQRPAPLPATLSPDLVAICERAMALDPDDRYADATALAEALGRWLEGAAARERALREVARHDELMARAAVVRAVAEPELRRALDDLSKVAAWEPEDHKAPYWAAVDAARATHGEADLLEVQAEAALYAALGQDGDLPEAHDALARHFRRQMEEAEAKRDPAAAARFEARMLQHLGRLRPEDATRRALEAWHRGDGTLTLLTDPPGAEVVLCAWRTHHRRLVAEEVRVLGTTPLVDVPLPRGSWLLRLRAAGRPEVRYPVLLERSGRWDGVRPGDTEPAVVALPTAEELGPHGVYVPPGWSWSGGDDQAIGAPLPRRRLWCDGFILDRFPVTFGRYLQFLEGLVAAGRREEAERHVPRAPDIGPMLVLEDDGRFRPVTPAAATHTRADLPVVNVCLADAVAFAAWLREVDGLPWRLPSELEREKAGRGADGRFMPWGDHHDATWSRVNSSSGGAVRPVEVGEYPIDESPFGVRGLSGNVTDWSPEAFVRDGPPRDGDRVVAPPLPAVDPVFRAVVRGGAFSGGLGAQRLCSRYAYASDARTTMISFRTARSWPR